MINTPDRRLAIALIDEARGAGARLKPACAVLELSVRTFQRGGPKRTLSKLTGVLKPCGLNPPIS